MYQNRFATPLHCEKYTLLKSDGTYFKGSYPRIVRRGINFMFLEARGPRLVQSSIPYAIIHKYPFHSDRMVGTFYFPYVILGQMMVI